VSSILDALRELERNRPRPAAPRAGAVLDAPPAREERSGTFIAVAGGLAVGIVVFGIVAWGIGFTSGGRTDVAAPPPTAVPPAETSGADRPAWLDKAEAPRARVDGSATPDHPARASVRRAPDADEAAPPPRAESRPNAPAGQVVVESIAYSERANERTATLRLNGRRVTLRQRESADGVEVQLIMPSGVYVQRGSEVFLLSAGH